MKLKKVYISFLILFLAAPVVAQNIREVFKQMPDSMFPYITNTNRLDFIDFKDANMKAEVNNSLGGKSEMKVLTDNYIEVELSSVSNLQIRLLPKDSTKVICMVTTFFGPEADSKVQFFSLNWKPLDIKSAVPSFDDFFVKPDSINTERFVQLKKMIEPVMYYVMLSSKDNTITYSLSLPLLNKEDKKALDAVLRKVTLKWAGKSFM
jgi:hypothetical protein